MKYILLYASWLSISVTGFSQVKYQYYFDKDLHPSENEDTVFNGMGNYMEDIFELKISDSKTGKLVAVEHYIDSALQVKDGLFLSYHSSTSPASEGSFVKGKEDGVWRRWDTLGNTIDSTVYQGGEKILEVHTGYHTNGTIDSFVVNDIKTGRLAKKYFNPEGQMLTEIEFNGENGIVKHYKEGILMSTDTVDTRMESKAFFPGGEKAWMKYIMRQLSKNVDAMVKEGVSGTCRVAFIIDKDGKVRNAQAITMQGTSLAKIAVKLVTKSPKWIPAEQYGRPVSEHRKQPFTFMTVK